MTSSLIIVTGLSGSGKTTALKALEDFGCEVIDNIPITLCSTLLQEKDFKGPLALGIDIRTRGFQHDSFLTYLASLKQNPSLSVKLLFFEASQAVLERRYKESRRYHPLLGQEEKEESIAFLIEKEREILSPLRHYADEIIDTTSLCPPEVRKWISNALCLETKRSPTLYFLSFKYPRGLPLGADMVFDMRFLPNPYYVPSLRSMTGESSDIAAYFDREPLFNEFISLTETLLVELIFQDLRPSFLLAFGCSGGKHRSVYTAEKMSKNLNKKGFTCFVSHRDIV